jgi:hypothetical protein
MFQWALYNGGRALQSRFWRNDAASPRLAGARNLPVDLYPDAVPWIAFLRVLDAPREGAGGTLNQQKNTLYFQAMPPYRLLKHEGPTFLGGPEVTTELIRFYSGFSIFK